MMELLKLSSFKALRRPKLRLFANSCRLFLAFISADFYCHLLPFISAVFVCFACFPVVYLSLSLSRLAASPSCFYYFIPLFFGLLRSLPHILPFTCFSFCPGMLYFVHLRSFRQFVYVQPRSQSIRYLCPTERENEDLWEIAFELNISLANNRACAAAPEVDEQ